MRIVLTQTGITKFLSTKDGIDLDIFPGIPFEVPTEIAQSRIKASPGLFREATEEDEKKAEEVKAQKIAELNNLIKEKTAEVEKVVKVVESLEGKEKLSEQKEPAEFDPLDFLASEEPTEDRLKSLERKQLLEVGKAVELDFPGNIATVKLIQLILEKISEKEN